MSGVEIQHGGLESWDAKEKAIDLLHHFTIENIIRLVRKWVMLEP
jgi:hypothetical protein